MTANLWGICCLHHKHRGLRDMLKWGQNNISCIAGATTTVKEKKKEDRKWMKHQKKKSYKDNEDRRKTDDKDERNKATTEKRTMIEEPQMWERAQVGFGGTGRKRKSPCTKQCALQKHGLCDTRLAEACPPKL